jgi:hypothetical protein
VYHGAYQRRNQLHGWEQRWQAAASSSAGHKRAREPEIHDDCSCAVCWEVLLDPVGLPCGHTLDQRCLQLLVAAGGSACPTCREPLPAVLPNVNVQLRNGVQRQYPQQVAPPPSDLETLLGATRQGGLI